MSIKSYALAYTVGIITLGVAASKLLEACRDVVLASL